MGDRLVFDLYPITQIRFVNLSWLEFILLKVFSFLQLQHVCPFVRFALITPHTTEPTVKIYNNLSILYRKRKLEI